MDSVRELPPVEQRIGLIIGLSRLETSRLLPAIEACGFELVPKVKAADMVLVPRDLAERSVDAFEMVSREPKNWSASVNQPLADAEAMQAILERGDAVRLRTRDQREKFVAISFLPVMWICFVIIDYIADRSIWGAIRDVSIGIGVIVVIIAMTWIVAGWVLRGDRS